MQRDLKGLLSLEGCLGNWSPRRPSAPWVRSYKLDKKLSIEERGSLAGQGYVLLSPESGDTKLNHRFKGSAPSSIVLAKPVPSSENYEPQSVSHK